MKKILLAMLALAATFTTSNAFAEYCTYELQDFRGSVLERVTESGYTRFNACQNAQRECERAQYLRTRRGQQSGHCVQAGRIDPRPPRGRFTCTSDLHRGNGSIFRTFRAAGRNQGEACKDARRQCEFEAQRMRRGPGRDAVYCTTNPGGGAGQIVSKTCSTELVSPRFGLQQVFTGYASGRIESLVQREACDSAMSQCQMRRVRSQFCRQR